MTNWRVRVGSRRGAAVPVLLEGDEQSERSSAIKAFRAVGLSGEVVYVNGARWSLDDHQTVAESGLANGALVTSYPSTPDELASGTYVVAVGGPDAGRAALLTAGVPIVVGRQPDGNGLAIADQLLSAEHFAVELSADGRVKVSDLGSTNGSMIEGRALESEYLQPHGAVQAGSSLFTVTTLSDQDHAIIRGQTPTGLNLHRQFREALPDLPPAPKPPTAPQESDEMPGSPWWRSMTPLVTAVGMAVMFGRWQFLIFAALSPVVFIVDNQRRTRFRKQKAVRKQQEYEDALVRHRELMAERQHAEVLRARHRFIGGGSASLLARFRHRQVWERRPDDPDFLKMTLGHAALASKYGEGSTRELWQAPLSISLRDEGPLSISGERDRAAAVLRSLLIELTFTHAPVDVWIWVLSDEAHSDYWDFAQWLPHLFTDDGGARLATTTTSRASLMRVLKGLIETRLENLEKGENKLVLPAHVIVIDGADSVSPADLAQLLRDGPRVGVFGIVSDPSTVPEGVRGQVRIGRFDDESTFRSELTPLVDNVVVSALAPELALSAALALSPLEAFGTGSTSRPIGAVYFTELTAFGQRSPSEQVDVWSKTSPRTMVPIGVDMDGQSFSIDVVRHGPHGLIGGMTRSGKTEFLKTLFSSLALNNHPDDLAIAIIDFKGGVDHQITARLPHVVVLATNQDIDLFERTVTLIAAEQQRRQRIFRDEAGVATIEGYFTARESRPDLIAVPRLLVIVDEFVELLKTPEGHAQLGRLEQIARIGAGLGVHLLLVTQDFTSTLPPQIDGQAGLRVCFKVAKPADSKTVLIGSGIAANISASTKGRGYARFMGGDLMEFQSARIGNQARTLITGDQIAAYFVTADTLTQPPEPPQVREVPNEQQDLWRVVEIVRKAAQLTGFERSAVPWPSDLPDRIGLVDVAERFNHPPMVIGLADEPAQQRNLPVTHSFTDAVVSYSGSADSGHHDTIFSTIAVSAAAMSPDDLHIYGIDLIGRGLSQIEPLPHVGGVATKDDVTATRILSWLMSEAARRRATISRFGASDYASYRSMGGTELPQIMLAVLGLDRVMRYGEGTSSPLLYPLTSVMNEVSGTGIQIIFSGNTMVSSSRFGSFASRRLVFAANDPADYPSTVPRNLRSQITVPGRCVDSESGLLAQIGVVNIVDGESLSQRDVFLALAEELQDRFPRTNPPKTFVRAPWPLDISEVDIARLDNPPAGTTKLLPFGVQPDTSDLFWIDPNEDGKAFRVVGNPKSGRSNALAAIALMAARAGWEVLIATTSQRSTLLNVPALQSRIVPIEVVVQVVSQGVSRPTVILIDDAHRLDPEFPWKLFSSPDPELGSEIIVTVVAGSGDGLTSLQFGTRGLNVAGSVVLMPTRQRDVSLVGMNGVDEEWLISPLAGVGVASIASEAHKIQYPLIVDL